MRSPVVLQDLIGVSQREGAVEAASSRCRRLCEASAQMVKLPVVTVPVKPVISIRRSNESVNARMRHPGRSPRRSGR
jgi:hypothetical protein